MSAAIPAQASEPPSRVDPLGSDFLWGVATSGFQSEGNTPDSNWTRYITEFGHEPIGNSIDFYNRYPMDIAAAVALGIKVFRLGLEWARVQPHPEQWDEHGFAFYDRVIDLVVSSGMRPMITLDHWVYPGWQAERGGWADPGMVENWLANMRRVVDRYDSRNPLWVTINEPIAYVVQELNHHTPPLDGPEWDRRFHEMEDRFAEAHNRIYDHIHAKRADALVTSNVGFVAKSDASVNDRMFGLIADRLDFVSLDYYFGAETDATTRPRPRSQVAAAPTGLWDLPLQAEGIYYAIRRYARKFPGKKIYIAENGMATENGRPRPDDYGRADYLRDVVYWLQRARMAGFDVIGYNYWSLTDNYEWGSYAPRFGLYRVDVTTDRTLTRRATDAVGAYAEIIERGGVPADYLPTRPPVPHSQVDPPSSYEDPVTLPQRS
ncbi:family 1 glycosylhydrolase [Nocardia sp. CDC159]|uniref:Family 1 glycosylhydrolase n=1 Tax=Nocardia pulmonis TaxID=2951408 RepID=A0A9X2EB83_9NOCA|nr:MULTISPECIES: family 1 glycosylhydrolase [Nocardia]MCM6777111.1 family 1 glycosylhydrolase [Nocardia pulmonis]MCM6789996.1 family 1 glycosylhydrolase [Nocardia sp. CDC159]